MEDLGAGGTISELLSCHGINYASEKTLHMLRPDAREENLGLQLFGEDAQSMARAAKTAEQTGPKFIDINMGCPVKKVVSKGAGSALLKNPTSLGKFFGHIRSAISIPLTVKIRTGWDENSINAMEVIHIAKQEGLDFVAIHGRTRAQQYKGRANWELLETLAQDSPLPLIGNGDLHNYQQVRSRMLNTKCQGLMLGRGPLRLPFIFLEAYLNEGEVSPFTPADYFEVLNRYAHYLQEHSRLERVVEVQIKKHAVWMAGGFPYSAQFRGQIFESKGVKNILHACQEFFLSLPQMTKEIHFDESFMAGGHG